MTGALLSGITISSRPERRGSSGDAFGLREFRGPAPKSVFGRLTLAGSPITTTVIILPFHSLPSAASSLLLQLIIMRMIDEITMNCFILLLILIFHLDLEMWLPVLDGESCVSNRE